MTEKFDGKRLVTMLLKLLLKLRRTSNKAIREQVVKLDADIQALNHEIKQAELDMNARTYRLYNLTDEEIRLVEGHKEN